MVLLGERFAPAAANVTVALACSEAADDDGDDAVGSYAYGDDGVDRRRRRERRGLRRRRLDEDDDDDEEDDDDPYGALSYEYATTAAAFEGGAAVEVRARTMEGRRAARQEPPVS